MDVLAEMLKRLSESDNKTVSIISGVPGSGKSFASMSVKERNRMYELETILRNNLDVQIVTIDNSHNQGREVSNEEALNWDYTVSEEQKLYLKNLVQNNDEIDEETKQKILANYESVQGGQGMARTIQQGTRGEQQTDRRGTGREVQATGLLSQDETPDLDQAAREQRDDTLYSLVPDNERRVLQAPGIITRNQAENDPET